MSGKGHNGHLMCSNGIVEQYNDVGKNKEIGRMYFLTRIVKTCNFVRLPSNFCSRKCEFTV